ncbi:MAG: MBG-2 domain-containing protein, partial [Chloroflexi bacterium]|nr:MBG-2 domain-containing protein [Chloroflexota bacterium]
MRTSTPNSWSSRATDPRVLVILMIALVVLAAASVAYAVDFTPDTPPGTRANPLPDTTYGAPYGPNGPISIRADGTNAQTQFFIEQDPPDTYNPPLGTRLPYGLELVRIAQDEARIQGTVTESVPAGAEYAEITFVVGVTGDANTPPGSGTYSGRGYLIRVYRAPLTVTVNNTSRAYGAANPELTYTVSGLRNGDTAAQVLQGALATTANASSPVGTYNITQGALALTAYGAARYALTFIPGTLSVTPASLTVRANDATRRVGAPNPAFSVSYSGFVNSEDESVLGGTL